ncbi:MAG: hypothetical protein RHS_2939 [Robinsoniella sp. RHS]|nr:MAG: hypothetical protein RHS_2939 [Robinsoniella sp. RHS]
MDYQFIQEKVSDVIIECGIKSFPIDTFHLLRLYGYKIYTYDEIRYQNEQLYEVAIKYSSDAFRFKGIVCYNSNQASGRICFSLMHELGHHILGHNGDQKQNEIEANYFASNILAPRMAIYYAGCKNANDVHRLFKITYEASEYAFEDFRRWRRYLVTHGHRFTPVEMAIYHQFYNQDQDKFVWSIRECSKCGRSIYNDLFASLCCRCKQKKISRRSKTFLCDDPIFGLFCDEQSQQNIRIAEYKWLYGDDY